MNRIKQAVILAGGLGLRMKPFTDTAPKPMYPIEGMPFLEHLLLQVKSFGINEVVLLLGYMPQKIQDYFEDGSRLGLNITYSITAVDNETQARLYAARNLIKDDFLLMYCDNYCALDFNKMKSQFFSGSSLIQITAYDNTDGYTKNNLLIDSDNHVLKYDKKRAGSCLNAVEIGYALIKCEVLDMIDGSNINFEENIYTKLAGTDSLRAYQTKHRYYSIGSYERIELTKKFFKRQKIAFLDRDGTLNIKAPKAQYITDPKEFIWIEGAKESVKILNENKYKIFIITNQPGVARGIMSVCDTEKIHQKMLNDLKEIGAVIDDIFICYHGWGDGCECRKPKPGMLFEAQRKYNFNMFDAVFFGDDDRDMEAAEAAGCKKYLIGSGTSLLDAVRDEMRVMINA